MFRRHSSPVSWGLSPLHFPPGRYVSRRLEKWSTFHDLAMAGVSRHLQAGLDGCFVHPAPHPPSSGVRYKEMSRRDVKSAGQGETQALRGRRRLPDSEPCQLKCKPVEYVDLGLMGNLQILC